MVNFMMRPDKLVDDQGNPTPAAAQMNQNVLNFIDPSRAFPTATKVVEDTTPLGALARPLTVPAAVLYDSFSGVANNVSEALPKIGNFLTTPMVQRQNTGEAYPTRDVPTLDQMVGAMPSLANPGAVKQTTAQQPAAAAAFRNLFAGLTEKQVNQLMAQALGDKEKPMAGRDIGSREYLSIAKSEYLAAIGAAEQEKDPKKRMEKLSAARGTYAQKLLPTFMSNPTNQAIAEGMQ